MHPWEFDKDLDTPKSFQGFTCYRDLGPTRTLESAYQVYKKPQKSAGRVPGFFKEWSSKGQWVDRCLDFDLENDRTNREAATGEARRHQNERIEQIRQMTESIAIARLSTSLRSAVMVRDSIAALQERCTRDGKAILSREDADDLLVLISIQGKDSATIEASLKLADDSLGISALIEQLAT